MHPRSTYHQTKSGSCFAKVRASSANDDSAIPSSLIPFVVGNMAYKSALDIRSRSSREAITFGLVLLRVICLKSSNLTFNVKVFASVLVLSQWSQTLRTRGF